jgi:hypothetical protein
MLQILNIQVGQMTLPIDYYFTANVGVVAKEALQGKKLHYNLPLPLERIGKVSNSEIDLWWHLTNDIAKFSSMRPYNKSPVYSNEQAESLLRILLPLCNSMRCRIYITVKLRKCLAIQAGILWRVYYKA